MRLNGRMAKQRMSTLVPRVEDMVSQEYVRELKISIPMRFSGNPSKYGIKPQSLSTLASKVRRGIPPNTLVDSGRLKQYIMSANWIIKKVGNSRIISVSLPGYAKILRENQRDFLRLTPSEIKAILSRAKSRISRHRI